MITEKEQALIDGVTAIENDFYAPLLALVLSRYDATHQGGKRGLNYEEIHNIVINSYRDLNNSEA